MSHHPGRRASAGFTLLEVLLAITIFAALSLGGYQVLQGVLANDAQTRVKGERLANLQRAFTVLERDFSQALARPSRIEGEPSTAVFQAEQYQMQSDDWAVAWVRAGWLNPDALLPRSQLQKVGYRLRGGQLERLNYLYPDPAIGTEATVVPLLDGVRGFTLRFFGQRGWQAAWEDAEQLPAGVEVTLTLDDYGQLRWRFLLATEAPS